MLYMIFKGDAKLMQVYVQWEVEAEKRVRTNMTASHRD